MEVDTFASRLRQLLDESGMRQADLAARTGMYRSSIAGYLSGKYVPKQDAVLKIARATGADPGWLVSGIRQVKPTKRIPVLGEIRAGQPIVAMESVEEWRDVEDVSLDYALRVKGDSMVGARISDGDIVLVSKEAEVKNGDIVVALVNGDEATIKRYHRYGVRVVLRPENIKYTEQEYQAGDVRILGKVKEISIRLE